MEFKKCKRCGCFFSSNNEICCNCAPKDKFEISELKNYFENNESQNSINNISIATGISIKNINRYLASNDDLNKFSNQFTNYSLKNNSLNNKDSNVQL